MPALRAVPPAGFKIGATTRQMQAYLGLAGPAAGFVRRAAVVSAPLDLNAGGAALKHGPSLIYTRMFLRSLKRKTAAKTNAADQRECWLFTFRQSSKPAAHRLFISSDRVLA